MLPKSDEVRAKSVTVNDDELPIYEDDLLNCPNCGRYSDCEENCKSRHTDEEIVDENGEVTDKVWEEVMSGKNPTHEQLKKLNEILNKGGTTEAVKSSGN